MIRTYTHKNVTWIDLENPTNEEIRKVMEERNIHPLVAQELIGHPVKLNLRIEGENLSQYEEALPLK